jgi:peroxin-2
VLLLLLLLLLPLLPTDLTPRRRPSPFVHPSIHPDVVDVAVAEPPTADRRPPPSRDTSSAASPIGILVAAAAAEPTTTTPTTRPPPDAAAAAAMTSLTFAEAQQRLLERRAAREAALAPPASPSAAQRTALQTRLHTLTSAPKNALSALSTLARPAFRVGQLDASLLDDELVDLLKGHVGDALKHFSGGALSQDWAAEIQLALRAVLFKLSVWDHDASYGAALQNLRYSDARHRPGSVIVPPSRWQKGAYGLVTVFGRYAWDRWEGWLAERDDGLSADDDDDDADDGRARRSRRTIQTLARLTEWARTVHAAAAVVSFLVFLLRGHYRTLLDRILRMRLVSPTSQVSREVSFEYQNRQLVWHAFTEFLLFVLPLLGISRWKRWFSRTWRRTKAILQQSSSGEDPDAAADAKPDGEYAFLPERTCAICYHEQNATASSESEMLAAASGSGGVIGSAATDVTNPYEALPCGCVYCFVCIANSLDGEEGEGWTCLRCGVLVKECKPWSGDVVEPKRAAKSVAFEAIEESGGGGDGELRVVDARPLDDH